MQSNDLRKPSMGSNTEDQNVSPKTKKTRIQELHSVVIPTKKSYQRKLANPSHYAVDPQQTRLRIRHSEKYPAINAQRGNVFKLEARLV